MPEFFQVDGCRGYIFQEVFFTEGFPDSAESITSCEAISNVQNTNLDWLREKLATQVKESGGNALVGFKYVQKANFLSFSSVTWRANGTAARISNLNEHRESSAGNNSGASEKKSCSYCGEEIMAIAKKCKHCGEFF